MSTEREGRVITRFGAGLIIEDDHGGLHRATGRKRVTHAACGDRVLWQPLDHGAAVTTVLPRHSCLERIDTHGRRRTLAANIDLVAVVFAPFPAPAIALIDRCLVSAHALDADVLLVLNKTDLTAPGDEASRIADEYGALGYPILRISAKGGTGMGEFASHFRGRAGILVGQSGVGKSSIIEALLPDAEIRTGALSEASGEGRHTTTNAVLYHLPAGGDLIDSPGIRDFNPGRLEPTTLARGFIEFRPLLGHCRFQDCRHDAEPGCAVKAAVKSGAITEARYARYLAMLRDDGA